MIFSQRPIIPRYYDKKEILIFQKVISEDFSNLWTMTSDRAQWITSTISSKACGDGHLRTTTRSSNAILRPHRPTIVLPDFRIIQNTKQTRSVNLFCGIYSLYLNTHGKWVKKHHPYVIVDVQKKLLYTISSIAKFTMNSDPKKFDKVNLLCKDDCDEMEKFILKTKKLNKDEETWNYPISGLN